MLRVTAISQNSPAFKAGLLIGDELLSLNGQPIDDQLDYQFHQAAGSISLKISRAGEILSKRIAKDIDSDLGLIFQPDRIIRCRNNCVFCFVHNNPKGLRQPLYVKDDDYRMSFIHGNFVTLTNVSDNEIDRIIKMRLSPMYISVQATNEKIRQILFGRTHLPPLMPILEKLAANRIYFHSQVVAVPGFNDGDILDQTAADLANLHPYAISLAVVPVGLTKYSRTAIGETGKVIPVGAMLASKLIRQVEQLRKQYKDNENSFAYAADELFIRSRMSIPSAKYYDDYPQIENGVGMVRQFIDSIPRKISAKKKKSLAERGVWITGRSMEQIWQKYIFPNYNFTVNLLPVTNGLFGPKVTVSGLLAGKDILKRLKKMNPQSGPAIIPPNCLNHDGKFIDDLIPQELADQSGMDIAQGTYDFAETIRLLS